MKKISLLCLISLLCSISLTAQKPEIKPVTITETTYKSVRIKGCAVGENITERGLCLTTAGMNKKDDKYISLGTGGVGSFSYELNNLTPNTEYSVKAYATSGRKKYYGEELIFTTPEAPVPLVITKSVGDITSTGARAHGKVDGPGVTERGACLSTSPNQHIAELYLDLGNSGYGGFSQEISFLEPNTTYYLRIYAKTGSGTYYGKELSFKTAEAK